MSYETDIYAHPTAEPQVFMLNHEHLIFHDLQMEVKDITGILYGFRYGQGTNMQGYGQYLYQFVDSSNDVIAFGFYNDPATMHQNMILHAEIEQAIWFYAGNVLLNKTVRAIHDGHELIIGHVTLNRLGIHIEDQSYMGSRKQTIPWREASGYVQNGMLFITSYYNSSTSTALNLLSAYNAVVLHRILQYLGSNKYLIEVLNGTMPPLA